MFYLTCTTITSVDLAHDRVSRAKDWVSVDCGTRLNSEDERGFEILQIILQMQILSFCFLAF